MEINELRKRIDRVDEGIVSLLAQRMEIVDSIAAIKKKQDIPMLDAGREEQIHERLGGLAVGKGLRPEFVSSLYEKILAESKRNRL